MERVACFCEQALIDHVHDAIGATEERGLAEADHQSKQDRAAGAREPTGHRDQNHEQLAGGPRAGLRDQIGGDDTSSQWRVAMTLPLMGLAEMTPHL